MSTATLHRDPARTSPAARTAARPAARPAAGAVRPARPARPRAAATVRLTRRGRVVVVLVLAALLLALVSLGYSGTSQAGAGDEAVTPLGVTRVEAGETLWGVARRIAPDHDARQVVEQIRELNGMGTTTLQVGQQLLLPVAA